MFFCLGFVCRIELRCQYVLPAPPLFFCCINIQMCLKATTSFTSHNLCTARCWSSAALVDVTSHMSENWHRSVIPVVVSKQSTQLSNARLLKSAIQRHYVEQRSKIACEITTNNRKHKKKLLQLLWLLLFLTLQLFIQKSNGADL